MTTHVVHIPPSLDEPDGTAPPEVAVEYWADKIARALDADPLGDFDTVTRRTLRTTQ